MRARWELAAQTPSVPRVRLAVRRLLVEAGSPPDEREAVELVTTELVTNSIVHSHTGENIEVSIQLTDSRIHIEVRDHESEVPAPDSSRDDSSHGRGLLLIDGIASQWGWAPIENGGKTVWCDVDRARPRA